VCAAFLFRVAQKQGQLKIVSNKIFTLDSLMFSSIDILRLYIISAKEPALLHRIRFHVTGWQRFDLFDGISRGDVYEQVPQILDYSPLHRTKLGSALGCQISQTIYS
jgi:hypothetical protein